MDNLDIQTGTGGSRSIFTKRNMMILLAIIVVGLVIYLIVYFVTRPKGNTTVQSALISSEEAFNNGDYTGAMAALQGVSTQNMTKAQKLELYSSLAAAAASSGKVDEALHYYELRHEIDPSKAKEDAYSMALLYMRQDNNKKAIEQLKIAIDYYKKNKQFNNSNNDLSVMEAQLQELEAKQ